MPVDGEGCLSSGLSSNRRLCWFSEQAFVCGVAYPRLLDLEPARQNIEGGLANAQKRADPCGAGQHGVEGVWGRGGEGAPAWVQQAPYLAQAASGCGRSDG